MLLISQSFRYVITHKILDQPRWGDVSGSKGLVAQRKEPNLMVSIDLHKSQAPVILALEAEIER